MLTRLLSTKTFWTGLGLAGYGVYLLVTGSTQEGITTIGLGLTGIFVRDGIAKAQGQ